MSESIENEDIQAAPDGDEASLLMFIEVGEERGNYDLYEMPLMKSKDGVGMLKKLPHSLVLEHGGSPSHSSITSIGSKVYLVGNITDEYMGCDRTLVKYPPLSSSLVLVVDRQTGCVYEGPCLTSGKLAPHLLTFGTHILAFSHVLWHEFDDEYDNTCLEKNPRFELWDTSQPSSKWRPFPHPIISEHPEDEFLCRVDAYAASSTMAFISIPEIHCSYSCDLTYWANLKGGRKRGFGATRGVPTWILHMEEELPFKGLAYLVDDAASLFVGCGRFHHQVIVCKLQRPPGPGRALYEIITSYSYPSSSPNLHRMFDIETSITFLHSLAEMCIVYRGCRLKDLDGACSLNMVVGRFAFPPHEGDDDTNDDVGVAKWVRNNSAGARVECLDESNDNMNLPEFELISGIECPEIPEGLAHYVVV